MASAPSSSLMLAEYPLRAHNAHNSEVIDTRTAAAFLQVHVTTLQELARRGEVPCRKVGKDYRFLREALQNWLQGNTPQRPRARTR